MQRRPSFHRRKAAIRLAALMFGVVVLATPARTGSGGQDHEVADFPETTEESKQAVERGLAYLASVQAPDGSLGGEPGMDGSQGGDFKVAVTSLACLSFMANGNVPGRGKYGETVRKGLRYILDCAHLSTKGYITEAIQSKSRMHGHGYATMFLAEVLGMAEGVRGINKDEVRSALRHAVEVIVSSQTTPKKPIGGWGYEPNRDMPDEASVTVTAVQALRAARDAGIYVDGEQVIDRAIEYVKACYDPGTKSFRYSIMMNNRHSSFALTAAAVSVLNYAGAYDAEEIRGGLEFMMGNSSSRGMRGRSGHYFYENFYATLATYNAGGVYWKVWCPLIRDELLGQQQSNGSWHNEYSPAYCTAFATLILQIPNRYLPIFQR